MDGKCYQAEPQIVTALKAEEDPYPGFGDFVNSEILRKLVVKNVPPYFFLNRSVDTYFFSKKFLYQSDLK